MHSQWFFLPFRTVQYIEKTLHKLAHHRNYLTKQNKTYKKSLQWSEKKLPYLQAFKKEFDSLTTWRRQEETEDLSNKKNKTSSFQVQVTMNDKLNRMELSQGSTWWELALQIASRSPRMEKCLQEIHTSTDTDSNLVITHGSTQRKNVQREEEHLT